MANREHSSNKFPTPEDLVLQLEAAEAVLNGVPTKRLLNAGIDRQTRGLRLQLTPGKARPDGTPGTSKSWIFRFSLDGEQRGMGLGSYADISHTEALRIAREKQQRVDDGDDPIELEKEKRDERRIQAKGRKMTVQATAEEYIKAHAPEWKSEKYDAQWRHTMSTYVYPAIGQVRIGKLTKEQVKGILEPHWLTQTATMCKIRERLAAVVNFAVSRGYRSRNLENPAAWDGLAHELANPKKFYKTRHHPALPFQEIPAFVAALKRDPRLAARALEFCIYTTSRSEEARAARWEEIDLDERLWTIPPQRTKSRRGHVVPLSQAAVGVLRAINQGARPAGGKLTGPIFQLPSGELIGGRSLIRTARRARPEPLGTDAEGEPRFVTTHGFRTAFKRWSLRKTHFAREVVEECLSHKIGNAAENAYKHNEEDEIEKPLEAMTEVLEAWARFRTTPPADNNVVPWRRSA
jgi:integrase